jgi:signal transduction histidine kinase
MDLGARAVSERRRIRREIHDVLGHDLTLLGIFARAIESPEHLSIDEIRSAAKVIGDSVRRAQRDLTRILDARDEPAEPLVQSLNEMFGRVSDAGAAVRASVDPRVGRLSPGLQETVQRFCQEGLTNALKHASPGEISLTVEIVDRWVRMAIRSPLAARPRPRAASSTGLGLSGLRERALQHGGHSAITLENHCFCLRLDLPLAG